MEGTTRQRRSEYRRQVQRARRLKATQGVCENGCGWADPTGKTLELDHRVSLESGGTDSPDNVWLICLECHKNKTSAEQRVSKAAAFLRGDATRNPLQQ